MQRLKSGRVIRIFSLNLDATQIAVLTGLNRNTVNRFRKALRKRIAEYCESQSPCPERSKWMNPSSRADGSEEIKGEDAFGKTIVFGLLKRNGNVYTGIVPNCSNDTLQGIIRGKSGPGERPYRIWETPSGGGWERPVCFWSCPFNGIEGFWGFAKFRLTRFRGMSPSTFSLHLKECAFRINHRNQDLYKLILRLIPKNPLF